MRNVNHASIHTVTGIQLGNTVVVGTISMHVVDSLSKRVLGASVVEKPLFIGEYLNVGDSYQPTSDDQCPALCRTCSSGQLPCATLGLAERLPSKLRMSSKSHQPSERMPSWRSERRSYALVAAA